jgi:molybdopterin molybdotransferase
MLSVEQARDAIIAGVHPAGDIEQVALGEANGRFLAQDVRAQQAMLYARALSGQGSHMVGALRETNALIRLEAEDSGFDRGDQVTIIPLRLGS